MTVEFWGVRGSIPSPGPDTVEYGGNTSCIAIRYGSHNGLIVVDAGTGIKRLGDHLVKHELPHGPIRAHLFLTHTHWDHIMGFPFFTPIFIPGSEIDVYGPVTHENESIEKIIGLQLSYRYFPVRQNELSATIRYHELKEQSFELADGMRVTTKFLNHPVLCLGYRFDYDGKSVATVYDNEPFRNLFPADPEHPDYDPALAEEGEEAAREQNAQLQEFYRASDLLIHDSQYTLQEYLAARIGWGHSPFEFAINAAHKAEVNTLVFFHHDPLRTDAELHELLAGYRRMINGKTRVGLVVAQEQDSITV